MVPYRTPPGRGFVRETFVLQRHKVGLAWEGGGGGQGEGRRDDSEVTVCSVALLATC